MCSCIFNSLFIVEYEYVCWKFWNGCATYRCWNFNLECVYSATADVTVIGECPGILYSLNLCSHGWRDQIVETVFWGWGIVSWLLNICCSFRTVIYIAQINFSTNVSQTPCAVIWPRCWGMKSTLTLMWEQWWLVLMSTSVFPRWWRLHLTLDSQTVSLLEPTQMRFSPLSFLWQCQVNE